MTKPPSTRKADVDSKLEYVAHKHQELLQELFSAKKANYDPKFLAHMAGEVISVSRECFDYLIQDILDFYIIPLTENEKLKKKYAEGKLKTYFPFYTTQMTNPDSTLNELKNTNLELYNDLVSFTTSVDNKELIPRTLFNYSLFLDMKDMVNEKKHDQLTAVNSNENQEYIVENEGFSMVISKKEQKGWNSFSVAEGTMVKEVSEYRFAYNNGEVAKFCLFAWRATALVIQKFYEKYFD